MRLPESKIESAVSQEKSRYILQAVKFDVEGKRFLATDGHILAVVPTEVEPEDHSCLIHLDTIKNIRAMQKRAKSVPVNIVTNEKITATGVGETAEYEPVVGRFPNCDMIIPKEERALTFSFDADLFMRLVDALKAKEAGRFAGKRIVKLYVKDNQSAVVVKVSGEESFGLIMPYGVKDGSRD